MLTTRKFVLPALVALVLANPHGALAQGRDDEEFRGSTPVPQDERKGDGSSGGGFLGGIFGGDEDPIDRDEPFIESIDNDAWHIPPPKESPPGSDLARREVFGNDSVPIYAPAFRAYTERIALRLLGGVGITGFVPKVEISSTDDVWGNVYPDGTILVSLGMLRNMENEAEYAAFLAHELSHVLLKHYGEDWFLQTQDRGLAIYNLVLDIKREIETQKGEYGQSEMFGDLKTKLIAEAIVLGNEVFLAAPFEREQEDEADLLGMDLLVKAKYSPTGMLGMLEGLKAAEDEKKEAEEQEKKKQAAANGIPDLSMGGLFSSMGSLFGEGLSALKQGLKDEFGKGHRPTDERIERAKEYFKKHYRDDENPTLKKQWLDFLRGEAIADLKEGYRAVSESRKAFNQGNGDRALHHLRLALGKLRDPKHGLPRLLAAEMSAATGDYAMAIQFYEQASYGYKPSVSVYRGQADAMARLGKGDAAFAVLGKGEADLGKPPQLLPTRISLLTSTGQVDGTEKLEGTGAMIRCRVEGGDGLIKQCQKAANGEFRPVAGELPQNMRQEIASLSGGGDLQLASRTEGVPASGTVEVTASSLNGRRGPGSNHTAIASFPKGERLELEAKSGGWSRVRDRWGKTAWVSSDYIREVSTASSREESSTNAKTAVELERTQAPELKSPPKETQPPAKQAQSDGGNEDPVSRLKKLKTLRENDLITEEEYQAKRQEILAEL